jgi:hypothetical protein
VLLPDVQRRPRDGRSAHAYRKAREWMDKVIDLLKPGMSTDKVAAKLPKAGDIGFIVGDGSVRASTSATGWARPARASADLAAQSFKDPIELKAGMVFASRPTARRPTASRPRGSKRK